MPNKADLQRFAAWRARKKLREREKVENAEADAVEPSRSARDLATYSQLQVDIEAISPARPLPPEPIPPGLSRAEFIKRQSARYVAGCRIWHPLDSYPPPSEEVVDE